MWGDTGSYGDFATNFCPCGGGNEGTLIFECPSLGKNVGRDKERSIVHSIDGKMVEEKKKVSFKIHCFLSIKQTIKKTVKNLYVFVGISNFKIPLCIYCL